MHILKLQSLKGASYSIWWGVSLSYLPHAWNKGLRWHRELVRRKWTQEQRNKGGRPRISKDIESLIMRLAQENRTWGYGSIEGALLNLGHEISRALCHDILDFSA